MATQIMMKRTPLRRTKPLARQGPKAKAWRKFRDAKFDRDKDEDGFVRCQCRLIGLPDCGMYTDTPDLHHIVGRDLAPRRYFAEDNLVWLTRECHEKVT